MTWPLAAGFGRLGRTAPGDGQFAIWNVSWVAHSLTTGPLGLFDANIFHPHTETLAYSEINLVAGIVGIPGWLVTHNPYVAHNSRAGLRIRYVGVRHVAAGASTDGRLGSRGRRGGALRVLPVFFSHTPHIQLLMAGGIPIALLMMYRVAETPSIARGVALGVALAAQALACAYYGIFAGLLVGYTASLLGITRGRWRDRRYWLAHCDRRRGVSRYASCPSSCRSFDCSTREDSIGRSRIASAIPPTSRAISLRRRTRTDGCSRSSRIGRASTRCCSRVSSRCRSAVVGCGSRPFVPLTSATLDHLMHERQWFYLRHR